jgi:hypothetical protein
MALHEFELTQTTRMQVVNGHFLGNYVPPVALTKSKEKGEGAWKRLIDKIRPYCTLPLAPSPPSLSKVLLIIIFS